VANKHRAEDDLHRGPRAGIRRGATPTDADLLEGIVSRRDELAFAAEVERHGPMTATP
jgi:hypothetical protein